MAHLFGFMTRCRDDQLPREQVERILESMKRNLLPITGRKAVLVTQHACSTGVGLGVLGDDSCFAINEEAAPEPSLHSAAMVAGNPLSLDRAGSPSHVLRTTEAVPSLLDSWDGKFAAARFCARKRELILARDAMGQKPLFLLSTPRVAIFATAIKAFFTSEVVGFLGGIDVCQANRRGLAQYLSFQLTLGETTLFRHVQRLRPGWVYRLSSDVERAEGASYRSTKRNEGSPVSGAELQAAILASVKDHLPSQGKLLVLVSGGLDSSTVAGGVRHHGFSNVVSMTGYFGEGPEFDERPFARLAAVGDHQEVLITADDFGHRLEETIHALDQPMAGPGSVSQLCVARAVDPAVSVVFTGEGGDELFGGYARLLMCYHLSQGRSRSEIQKLLTPLGDYRLLLSRIGNEPGPESVVEDYLSILLRSPDRDSVFSPDFLRTLDLSGARDDARAEIMRSSSSPDLFDRILEFERCSLLPILLELDDLLLSAVGVAGVCPLLSRRVVAAARGISSRDHFEGRAGLKPMLRLAAEGLLPGAVLNRQDKKGFPLPLQQWAGTTLRKHFEEILLGRAARERGIFDPKAVVRLLDGEKPYSRVLWGALSLEIWFRKMEAMGLSRSS